MKKYYYLLVAMMMVMMTVGLTACGDDDDDEPNSQTNQRVQVDGQNWELSNFYPPVFNGDLGDGEYDFGLIFTGFIKKQDVAWYNFDYTGADVISLSIYGPKIKLGVNLLDNPEIWSIDVTYHHAKMDDADFFLADYEYRNPSKFGHSNSDYSGSIVVKEFIKDKKLTVEFKNFCLSDYVGSSWGPKISEHYKLVLNGTITYEAVDDVIEVYS